jgi:hypothetical protein
MTVAGRKVPEPARTHAPADMSRKRGGRDDGKIGYKTRSQTLKRLQHSKTKAVTSKGVRLKHNPAVGVAAPASGKKSRTINVGEDSLLSIHETIELEWARPAKIEANSGGRLRLPYLAQPRLSGATCGIAFEACIVAQERCKYKARTAN